MPTFSDDVEVFEGGPGELNMLDRDVDAMHGCSVEQDRPNEREIDRKGRRPGALSGSLPPKLDQSLAGHIFEVYAPKRGFERLKHHGFRSSNRLADISKIVEMQRDQIGKDARLLLRLGASDRRAALD